MRASVTVLSLIVVAVASARCLATVAAVSDVPHRRTGPVAAGRARRSHRGLHEKCSAAAQRPVAGSGAVAQVNISVQRRLGSPRPICGETLGPCPPAPPAADRGAGALACRSGPEVLVQLGRELQPRHAAVDERRCSVAQFPCGSRFVLLQPSPADPQRGWPWTYQMGHRT